MDLTSGLLGTVGEPDKVIKRCTGVIVFIIDAYELRTELSRIRVVVTPEPSATPNSTSVYAIQKVPRLEGRFRLVYNCRHDQTTSVNNCPRCDRGTVLFNSAQIDRLMFNKDPSDAMKWLSRQLRTLDAKGLVQLENGVVKGIEWWNNHPELKPPEERSSRSPWFGADRTPIPWSVWCAQNYPLPSPIPPDSSSEMDVDSPSNTVSTMTPLQPSHGRTTRGDARPSHTGSSRPSTAATSHTLSPHASLSSTSDASAPASGGQDTREGSRELYWDPVYESHDQNVVPDLSDWPDHMPRVPFFPFNDC